MYKYLFYCIYKWNNYLWKESDMAVFNSSLAMTLSKVLFVIDAGILMEEFLDIKALHYSYFNYIIVFVITSSLIINYFLFDHKNNYLKVIEKYDERDDSNFTRKFKCIITFGLTIAPLIFFIIYSTS